MRLFIALNFPAKERQRLHRAGKKLRAADLPMKWVDVKSLHLTFKFLEEVRPERAEDVKAAINRIAAKTPVLEVTLAGCGAFPTLRRPRVVWVGAEATPELRCLKHDLEWELAPLGFEREVRAFHPHVTLGRADKDARAGDFRAFEDLASEFDYEAKITVRNVDLMISHLSSKGARYERLLSASLMTPGKVKKAAS
ncbi:MAG TPA: RNA 2',3'-cyclic phosphodiesterase [Longimicrobiales bacterium]|nr:RNA 2',3'-cyclic phosphodiesterase [Longimicrobiales bacterium]